MTQLWGADLTGGGLLPAAIASRIGAQSQQPLARVVMGGMLTSVALILWVLPLCYQVLRRFQEKASPQDPA